MKKPRLQLPRKMVVPVFPLPNAILFPGARLPLYIFEPRDKQMVEDALMEERYISVALLKDPEGEALPAEFCGLGQITDVEHLPKNEKNIVLTGLVRVKLLREVAADPYIRAEVSPVAQRQPQPEKHELLFVKMREAVKQWLFRMRAGNIRQLAELGSCKSVAELCDFFGAYLLDDHGVRQQILAELNVSKRAALIIKLVRTRLYYYSAPFEN